MASASVLCGPVWCCVCVCASVCVVFCVLCCACALLAVDMCWCCCLAAWARRRTGATWGLARVQQVPQRCVQRALPGAKSHTVVWVCSQLCSHLGITCTSPMHPHTSHVSTYHQCTKTSVCKHKHSRLTWQHSFTPRSCPHQLFSSLRRETAEPVPRPARTQTFCLTSSLLIATRS